jgi:tetratricopeptide (TPR) repeat protein
MVDLLSVKLDGAGDLRTVDPHALLGPANALGVDEIDPAMGRTLAARFGAGQFVLGSVVSAGARLLVRIALYPLEAGDEIRVDAEADGEAGLSALLDDVVRRLLAGRSTSVGGHLGRLGAATTNSLPALKSYLAGERAFRQGRYVEAAGAYERALADDPAFPLAHYRLSAVRAATGRLADARHEADEAGRGRHLTVHVRLLLSGHSAWLDGDLDLAERRYLAVLDERPEDVDAWFGLGRLLFEGNPLRGRSAAAARDALARTVALDPRHVGAVALLARLAALERRPDEVESLIDRFAALSPEGDDIVALAGLRAGLRGGQAAQRDLLDRLAAARPAAVARAAVDLALAATDPPAALTLLEQFERLTAAPALGAFPALVAAHLASAHDLADHAARAWARAARLAPDATLGHRAWVAAAGPPGADPGELAAALSDWRPRTGESDPVGEEPWPQVRLYLSGLMELMAGRPERALELAAECDAGPRKDMAAGLRAREALARDAPGEALDFLSAIRLGPWIHRAAWSPFATLGLERALRGHALIALGRAEEGRAWLDVLGQRSVFELAARGQPRSWPGR